MEGNSSFRKIKQRLNTYFTKDDNIKIEINEEEATAYLIGTAFHLLNSKAEEKINLEFFKIVDDKIGINNTSDFGVSLLNLACTVRDNTKIVQELINVGANPNQVDSLMITPLLDAMYQKNFIAAKILLPHMDRNIILLRNKFGKSALDLAEGHPQMQNLINEALASKPEVKTLPDVVRVIQKTKDMSIAVGVEESQAPRKRYIKAKQKISARSASGVQGKINRPQNTAKYKIPDVKSPLIPEFPNTDFPLPIKNVQLKAPENNIISPNPTPRTSLITKQKPGMIRSRG